MTVLVTSTELLNRRHVYRIVTVYRGCNVISRMDSILRLPKDTELLESEGRNFNTR